MAVRPQLTRPSEKSLVEIRQALQRIQREVYDVGSPLLDGTNDTVAQDPTAGSLIFGSASAPSKWDELGFVATPDRYLSNRGSGNTLPSWDRITALGLVDGVADAIERLAAITVGAEGVPAADDIRFTIQANDIQGNALATRCVLDLWVGTASFGAPAGVQTFALSTGTILATLIAAQFIRVMTDATGKAVLDVNVVGAGTRHVMAGFPSVVVAASGTWV